MVPMRYILMGFAILVGVVVVRAEDPPASPAPAPFVLQTAEEKFSTEVARAEAELAKVRKSASEARLKSYKDRLTEATKAGDFDKAVAIKARVTELENKPESKATKRPRPKDVVRFQGHAYALIKEPATWHIAKQRCEEMGGHLVCVNNAAESDFVAKLCGKLIVAIGASDELEDGVLQNTDGTLPVFNVSPVHSRQPLDHWVVWDGTRFIVWQSGSRNAYICEWEH